MLHLTLPSTLTTGPVNGPQTKTPSGLRQAIRELLIITKKLARGGDGKTDNVQEGGSKQETSKRYGSSDGRASYSSANQVQGANNQQLGAFSTATPPERLRQNPTQLDAAQPRPVYTQTGNTEEESWGADGVGSYSGKGYNNGQGGASLGEGIEVRQDI